MNEREFMIRRIERRAKRKAVIVVEPVEKEVLLPPATEAEIAEFKIFADAREEAKQDWLIKYGFLEESVFRV